MKKLVMVAESLQGEKLVDTNANQEEKKIVKKSVFNVKFIIILK
jgi:hypothetical protein